MTRPREQSPAVHLRHNWQQQVTLRPRTQVPLVVDARFIERPRQRRPQGVVPPMWWETRRGRRIAVVVASVSVLAVAAAGWWIHAHWKVVVQALIIAAVALVVVTALVIKAKVSGRHCPGCPG